MDSSLSPAEVRPETAEKPERSSAEPSRLWFWLLAVALGLLIWSLLAPAGRVRETARRSIAASNLRQIGQASLRYASAHEDRLPQAVDVWGYAEQLAKGGGLNEASIWTTGSDPAEEAEASFLAAVLTADRTSLDPVFARLRPSWAVALGELTTDLPPTTPIAWSRGLRADGTWSQHSPYGTRGGHVLFLGGDVVFYRTTRDAFARFDGNGRTSDILEALPSGTRIGEYVPNRAERKDWARELQVRKVLKQVRSLGFPLVWSVALIFFAVQTRRRKWPGCHLICFLLLSLLVVVGASAQG